MSGGAEDLEILLKIRSEGQESLRQVTQLAKNLGEGLSQSAKDLNRQTEAVKKFASEAQASIEAFTKKIVEEAGNKSVAALDRETAAVERSVKALEKRAALAGKTGTQRIAAQQADIVGNFSGTEDQLKRVNASFATLLSQGDKFPNFAQQIRVGIQSPLYAAGQAAQSLLTSLGPLGLAIGATALVVTGGAYAIKKLADSLAATSLEITNFSLRVGLSLDKTQEFIAVSQVAGVNALALESSIRKLSQALADGGLEGKQSSDALRRLGIEAFEVSGKLRPLDDLIPQIFKGLQATPSIADRNVLALNLLGRSYKELAPVLEDYEKRAKQVRDTGVIIPDDAIKQADHYRQTMELLDLQWQHLTNTLKQKAVGIIEFIFPDTFDPDHLNGRTPTNLRLQGHRAVPKDNASPDVANQVRTFINGTKTDPISEALQRAKNTAQAKSLINQYDPQGAVTKAQQNLDELVKGLGTNVNNGTNLEAGIAGKLRDAQAQLKSAKALAEGPKKDEEQTQRLEEALAKELFGLAKISTEYDKQVGIIDRAGLHTDARIDKERKISEILATRYQNELQQTRVSAGREVVLAENTANQGLDRLKGEREGAIALAQNRITPDSRAGVDAAFEARKKQNAASRADASVSIGLLSSGLAGQKDPQQILATLKAIQLAGIAEAKRAGEEAYQAETQHILGLIALDTKRYDEKKDADRKIANIQVDQQKALISQTSQHTAVLSSVAAGGKGNEVSAAQKALQLRLALESQLIGAELGRIDASATADEKRVAAANAVKDIVVGTGEAQVQYETTIAELQKKRLEQYENESHKLAGALLTRGGFKTFVRDQSKSFETQILGNALTPALRSLGETGAGLIGGQRDANGNATGLGSLLKGTFLAPHDEQNVALKTNTASIDNNSQAVLQLIEAYTGQVVNIPGVASASIIPGSGPRSGGISGALTTASSKYGSLIQPLAFAGVGAALGDSLASSFEAPTLEKLSNPKTFKPALNQHPIATIGGAALGGLAGLLGFGKGSSAPGGGGGNSIVQPLIPIQTAQLATLQAILSKIGTLGAVAGGSGVPGLPSSLGSLFPTGALTGSLTGIDPSISDLPIQSGVPAGGFGIPGSPYSSLSSQAIKGFSGVASDGYNSAKSIFTGQDAKGNDISGAQRAGAAVGTASALYAGYQGISSGIKTGGARGTLGVIGSAAGTAAVFDPEPISKAILGAVALASSVVGGLLGDPKQARQNAINLQLQREQFIAPTTINQTTDTNGYNVSFDSLGHPYSSGSQGFTATQAQKYYFDGNGDYTQTPGYLTPNFSGPASPAGQSPSQAYGPHYTSAGGSSTVIQLNVNALDSQSILNRSADIGAAVAQAMQSSGPLVTRIQQAVLNG